MFLGDIRILVKYDLWILLIREKYDVIWEWIEFYYFEIKIWFFENKYVCKD